MANYKVTVNFPHTIKATQRVRSGVTVLRDGGYEGELTEEQLEAIKADGYLVVEEVKAPQAVKPKAKAKK